MTRTMTARKRTASDRLKGIDKDAIGRSIEYLGGDSWDAETAAGHLILACLPVQSVMFRKSLQGDYTAAISVARAIFPGCDWAMDQSGADMEVNGIEYGYEDPLPSAALISCVLDALMDLEP